MESEAVRSGAVTVTAGHVGGINGRLPGAVIVTDAVFVPTVSYVCGIEDAPVPDTVPITGYPSLSPALENSLTKL